MREYFDENKTESWSQRSDSSNRRSLYGEEDSYNRRPVNTNTLRNTGRSELSGENSYVGRSSGSEEGSYVRRTSASDDSSYARRNPASDDSSYVRRSSASDDSLYDRRTTASDDSSYVRRNPASDDSSYVRRTPASDDSSYVRRTSASDDSSYVRRTSASDDSSYVRRTSASNDSSYVRRTSASNDSLYVRRSTASKEPVHNSSKKEEVTYRNKRDAYRNEYPAYDNSYEEDYLEERQLRNEKRQKSRQKKIKTIIILLAIAVIAIFALILVFGNKNDKDNSDIENNSVAEVSSKENKSKKENKKSQAEQEKALRAEIMATAAFQEAQYDYDTAITTLKTIKNFETDEEVQNLITQYETTKASCTAYPVEEITHIFFHALLYEPEVSFGPTSTQPDGYNLYMTTVDEFNKILQSMYDRGYVLVSIYDIASPGEDGTFTAGSIMLPPGKKAFVLSEDDVNYYHAYDNGGIAEKLVIDPDTGKVKTRYIYQDGTVEIGNHDVVPILDEFIQQHPDFSYKGAKGILALTGYNGVLGYRTDPTYNTTEDRDRHQQAWLDAHPDFNYEEECAEASRVAQALREDGWLFASHSWGHLWQEKMSDNGFAIDAEKWMTRVYDIIGGTDIWIYPNGQDVDNDVYANRFNTLYNYGFRYFCPVNSLQYSVRIDSYGLNIGRRNLDGYRMYYDMIDDDVDRLSDLFDVNEVFDPVRPTPVPEI